ncbi:hypothetical protein [Sphingobium sp. EP60837]|uniref:hypothetical protein n=1 Tax=Sphingobium sp. EP60837 TaxID=1855519 RepID=UPI0007DDD8A1|nr:hypothetical protein [Sphingobium sp. EP60837]ANI78992.1 hypothetical protein EP837_02597 [Sphingobium sp. EP60837]
MSRLIGSLCVAFVAYAFAKGMGIPFWRDGWDVGDRVDIAMMAFGAAWYLAPRPSPGKEG